MRLCSIEAILIPPWLAPQSCRQVQRRRRCSDRLPTYPALPAFASIHRAYAE